MCVNVCPHGVFKVQDRKAAIIDKEACMECGACALNCPVNAIKVQSGVGCATAIIMEPSVKRASAPEAAGVLRRRIIQTRAAYAARRNSFE